MPEVSLTYEDLLRIVELVKSSEQFSEFRLKVGDIEVELRRRAPAVAPTPAAPPAPLAPAGSLPAATHAVPGAAPQTPPPVQATAPASAEPPTPHAADTSNAASPSGAANWPADAIVIRAPMVGTFYRSPEPGARPFVLVGDRVSVETTVCIIEVMKLMNSIVAGADGVVTHVLVEDAAPVEANQPLMVLAPHAP